jgi:putative transposase
VLNLTYEFKLKPTAKQIAIFEDWLEQCRRVYNYALPERKHWFGSRSCQINACSIRSEFIILGTRQSDQPMPVSAIL